MHEETILDAGFTEVELHPNSQCSYTRDRIAKERLPDEDLEMKEPGGLSLPSSVRDVLVMPCNRKTTRLRQQITDL